MLVGIAFAQVYVPTGVSTQSGIVRNVPTQFLRVPADTYITDGRQTYVAAQVPLQFFNRGSTNNNNNNNQFYTQTNRQTNQFQSFNVREENLRRLIESETRLRDLLLRADQDNDYNNNNYNSNYNTNTNKNHRFTTTGTTTTGTGTGTDTFGTYQEQTFDNTNDNTNFNRNTHLNRGQIRTLVPTTHHDTTNTDFTQQLRTNTDLNRFRDTTTTFGRV